MAIPQSLVNHPFPTHRGHLRSTRCQVGVSYLSKGVLAVALHHAPVATTQVQSRSIVSK